MSSTNSNNVSSITETDECANCGKGEGIKLPIKCCQDGVCECEIKYCSTDCKIAHRPQHEKDCKKRVLEINDEKKIVFRDISDEELFKQPPPKEDCPICFLRMPSLDPTGKKYKTCCGKQICSGCIHAVDKLGGHPLCPFCRTPSSTTDEEGNKRERKRMENNDPIAIYNHGNYYREGEYGHPQDHTKALELWHRAAELGYPEAYTNIGYSYQYREGVEVDMKKAVYYYKLAAIRGEGVARHNLGVLSVQSDNMDRAVKHYTMAAGCGYSDSLEQGTINVFLWRCDKR